MDITITIPVDFMPNLIKEFGDPNPDQTEADVISQGLFERCQEIDTRQRRDAKRGQVEQEIKTETETAVASVA